LFDFTYLGVWGIIDIDRGNSKGGCTLALNVTQKLI